MFLESKYLDFVFLRLFYQIEWLQNDVTFCLKGLRRLPRTILGLLNGMPTIFMFTINLLVRMHLWDNEGGIMNDHLSYIWIVHHIVGYNLGNIIY